MCDFCQKARSIDQYNTFISKMLEEDKERIENSKAAAQMLPSISKSIYSSMKWPVKFVCPMFDARAAYAVPNNYFQNLTLDEERLGNSFAHGAMRSVFFVGDRLVLFSKAVNFRDAKEFFTSFLLVHFEKSEYQAKQSAGEIIIKVQNEKPMINLVTGKVERKKIAFSFAHQSVEGRIVSKEQIATSARFKSVYDKYGGAQIKSASVDMEGYGITVPHFAPHPYMLQLHKEFGYEENKEFQLRVPDYFKAHIAQP